MTSGQGWALGCAIVLLLPGGCFLFVGLASSGFDGLGIGVTILAVAGALFWFALSGKPAGALPAERPNDGDEH